MKFNELKLDPRIQREIVERGYSEMTDVQQQTLKETLQGLDVAVQSQTGTGKTAAFLITLFERMLSGNEKRGKFALIIVPTRELAVQIEKEAKLLSRRLGFGIGSCFGGVGRNGQLAVLRKNPDIVIGTPGRLLDFCESGNLKLGNIGFLVIDEADRMFDMGFLPDIKRLIRRMPEKQNRQSMLFSATLNSVAKRIANEYLNDPVKIEVTPEQLTVDTISQRLYHVKSHIKLNLMLGILKAEAPQSVLIFTNMRHSASRLARKLQINGYKTQYLTGDLPQSQRLRIMDDFKMRKFEMLVATDVAARGLQIDDLDMVINYDIPQDCESYVHRIGRTARAGNTGKAITLASEGTFSHLVDIETLIGMKIPEHQADFEMFATDLSEGIRPAPSPRNGRSRHGGGNPGSKTRTDGRGGGKNRRPRSKARNYPVSPNGQRVRGADSRV